VFPINRHPSIKDIRDFGWAMVLAFGVIGAILCIPALNSQPGGPSQATDTRQIVAISLWAAGITLFALSRLTPAAMRPVYVAWMTVASALGFGMSTMLLSILYFAFLPVFAAIVRWRKRRDSRAESPSTHWRSHSPLEPTLERMKRMF